MKYFIIVTLLYFSYSIVFAMDEACVAECSPKCQQQAQEAQKALISHYSVCSGKKALQSEPECAQACSVGCKLVMLGQRQFLEDHYEVCSGGDGSFGRLECVNTPLGYRIINTHSLKYIGDIFKLESQCHESADTLN
ncbi:MAG: hypothetical protein KDD40_09945, partial [Bdellovibrionales bacterium]|nr:hypothetical protein [Bdellovibrionales bacterium]